MTKLSHLAAFILAGTIIFAGSASAQDTPATPPATQQAPAATPTAATTPKAATAPKSATTPKPAATPAKTGQAGATTTPKTTATKPGAASTAKKPAPLVLKTPKEKASYAMGLNMGRNLHKNNVDIDPAILYRGLKDGLAANKPLLTDQEAQAAMAELQKSVQMAQMEKMKTAGVANRKVGEDFLAANKAKAGVVALPSGLQYKVLTAGTGEKPTASDMVVCNYRGTLINGTEFDSSYKRGQPATFGVGQVIKGWTEALQMMPVGSKWQLFIPADLAYGDRDPGNGIGAGSTLIFDVELISIQPKKAAPAAPDAPKN
jgi:FKBP-type peptidyl-prolyl cis-trans isomerase FklB